MGPVILFLLACGGSTDSASTTTPAVGEPDPFPTTTDACAIGAGEWSLLSESVGDGVLLSAWSDGPEAVLMVGGDLAGGPGLLVRYDGASLCTESAVTERALWWIHGAVPGDWYAVGEDGTVLHELDGVRQREDLDTTATLYGVFAKPDAVWAVGGDPFAADSGEIWRREAGVWTQIAGGLPAVIFKVWEDLFVGDGVAYRWDGTQLVDVSPPDKLLTVRGRSAAEAYAVGGKTSAVVKHWDGSSWAEFDSTGLYGPLNGVWTAPDEDLWVTSFTGLMAHRTNDAWDVALPPLTVDDFHAVWGHCDEVLFVGGNMVSGPPFHGTIGRFGPPRGAVDVQECP